MTALALPQRAVVMIAKIEADTLTDLASHIFELATRIERGEFCGPLSISGGYSSGHIVHLHAGTDPSHNAWADNLKAYLHGLASGGNG